MYMIQKDEIQIQALLKHQKSKGLNLLPKEARKYLGEVLYIILLLINQ